MSRGWVINGSMDMLAWLSHRLEMPYRYGPTAGPMWGNGLLARFPITDSQQVDLPPRDLRLTRCFLWAQLQLSRGGTLGVINTHYHNPQDGGQARLDQSRAILDFWDGAPRTVLMGDLNARPHEDEIVMLGARFSDVLEKLDGKERYTSPSSNPRKQIDYILVTPDLTVIDVEVPRSTASDHLPVTVTLSP